MFKCYRVVILVFLSAFLLSCQPTDKHYRDQFWVMTDKVNMYEHPSITSQVLKELKFGDKIVCRDKASGYAIQKGWVEAKSDGVYGFIERRGLVGEDIYKEFKSVSDASIDAPAQASGLTVKKTKLRSKAEKDSPVFEVLKDPKNAEVLERLVTSINEKGQARRQVWYKIRLDNGRVGYVTRGSIQLTPPKELDNYTSVRTPVSWYTLAEKEDAATGEKGRDYLVSYSSVGSDTGTDFTRVELYTYDLKTKQYATALAKSDLYGILPIKVTEESNGRKIIELREHPHGDMKKIHVMQYSFPSPIKIVKEFVEDAG